MRTLEQALYDHELIVLRILGEWMDLHLTGEDKNACVSALTEALQRINLPQEKQYLPPEEAEALDALVAAGGRLPVATFSRQFGEVRLMGPGRLEREEPWYDPASPAEALWYRGFLYRAFDKTADGMVEFYYLPDELLAQFPRPEKPPEPEPALLLAPVEGPGPGPAADTTAVDDVTTLLIAAQLGRLSVSPDSSLQPHLRRGDPRRLGMLVDVGQTLQLLKRDDDRLRPSRPAVEWLKETRPAQLRALAEAWSGTPWNELLHTPGLVSEGSGWQNDPILARAALLDMLPRDERWYDLTQLVGLIKEENPDFQRPDGDYDTWYIREEESDAYLRGFEHWEAVEGRLLRFLVEGPLAWLGMTVCHEGRFRLTEHGVAWLENRPVPTGDPPTPLEITADAALRAAPATDRYSRFQAARIAETHPPGDDGIYVYQLTPRSLAEARTQGITPERVIRFLQRTGRGEIPASTQRAIERWAEMGTEARLVPAVVLRVQDAEILDKLRANPKTRPFIGESLGDMAVIIRQDQWPQLRRAAAQLGLLIDSEL